MQVKQGPADAFRRTVDQLSVNTNVVGDCVNFYRNERGTNFVLWPATVFRYRDRFDETLFRQKNSPDKLSSTNFGQIFTQKQQM
jgi:hypothetical protein